MTNEQKVLDFVDSKKVVAVAEVAKLLSTTNRLARDTLERLRRKGLIRKESNRVAINQGSQYKHTSKLVLYIPAVLG